MTYAEKLKDPRWQKKRLEIMQRDDFTCQKCFNTESTLSVHHKYYIYKNDPWDYPDELLITLCESCHTEEEEAKYVITDFAKVLLADGYMATELVQLLSLLHELSEGDIGLLYIKKAVEEYKDDLDFLFNKDHGKGSSSIVLHQ